MNLANKQLTHGLVIIYYLYYLMLTFTPKG